MNIEDLLKQKSEWLRGIGPDSDIVVSSRIRLARNLRGYPFTHWGGDDEKAEIIEKIVTVCEKISRLKGALFLRINEISKVDRQFLVERHLMSREFGAEPEHKMLIISSDEVMSVMVNEEDHLRIQTMKSGFDLKNAWNIIDAFDEALAKELDFAYHDEFGYLTACPTNVGTGMRASVMLHLPSLVLTKQIDKILQAIAKLSLTTRGLYGEGTEASGNFFQISNQVTLGRSESELIEHISGMIGQVIEHERNARNALLEKNEARLKDRVWRAFGILKSSRIITSSETIDLLSSVRLGCDLNILPGMNTELLNELFIITQPAHLQKLEGKKLTPEERDLKRAQIIRERLNI
ncbi:MAG: protein arginine kinase [Candidatus Omnitrophica bacterium]|nr:protein arginine kinase [Candidatus Omnitrophota bacterium]